MEKTADAHVSSIHEAHPGTLASRAFPLKENTRPFWLHAALLLACCAIATYPLIHTGLFQGHDLGIEVVRAAEYEHLLQAGVFPIRWGADLEGGYGYPIYNFFPPLFLLLTSLFIVAGGLSISISIKATLFLLTVAAGVGMYWFAREHFGRKGGILVACLYVLAPYHFMDVFIRNAFSEFTAFAVVPFVFYGLVRILKEESTNPGTTILLAVSGTLFLLSHNLSVAMYAPLFVVYCAMSAATTGQWKKIGRLAIPLLIAFMLSAFYTLPLLYESRFVQTWQLLGTEHFNVMNNFLSLQQLTRTWITPLFWALLVSSLATLIGFGNRIPNPAFAILWSFEVALLLCIFLVTPASKGVWSQMEFLKWFQFPWRLLSPASFLVCFVSGALIYIQRQGARNILVYGFIGLGIITSIGLSAVYTGSYALIPDQEVTPQKIREDRLPTTILSEYLPIWVSQRPAYPVKNRLTASRTDASVQLLENSPNQCRYKVVTTGETEFTAHVFYFPGWKVYANGVETNIQVPANGLMQFSLPQGRFNIEFRFEDTPVRILGNSLSAVGLLVLGIILFTAILRRQRWAL